MEKITFIISCLVCVYFSVIFVNVDEYESADKYVSDNYNAFINTTDSLVLKRKSLLPKQCHSSIDTTRINGILPLIDELYPARMEEYKTLIDKMSGLLQVLAAMVAIGLLILFYKPASLDFPILSISIPNTFLYLFVSVGLMYLWLQFGLTLNASIDERLSLMNMIFIKESFQNGFVHYSYSQMNVLADRGIVDTWFSYYHEVFSTSDTHNSGHIILSYMGLYGVYGTFIGWIHACCFTLLSVFYNIKRNKGIVVLYVLIMVMFIVSGYAFIREFSYGIYFMAWVWAVVALSVLWWHYNGQFIAEKVSAKNSLKE